MATSLAFGGGGADLHTVAIIIGYIVFLNFVVTIFRFNVLKMSLQATTSEQA